MAGDQERPESTTAVVGVVGAGTMGAGIAQLALAAGHEVILYDVDDAALDRARARIAGGLDRMAGKGRIDAAAVPGSIGRRGVAQVPALATTTCSAAAAPSRLRRPARSSSSAAGERQTFAVQTHSTDAGGSPITPGYVRTPPTPPILVESTPPAVPRG